MVDEMKEGIMERDEAKRGAWENVTEECTLEWWKDAFDGTKGHIDIQHDGQRVAIVGHQVNADVGGAFGQRGEYRVLTTPDGTYSGTIKVEHFIPEPEWVDVTEECTVRLGGRGSAAVCHNGVAVLSFGERVYKEDANCRRYGYRVTLEEGAFQGYFKVEKRNG